MKDLLTINESKFLRNPNNYKNIILLQYFCLLCLNFTKNLVEKIRIDNDKFNILILCKIYSTMLLHYAYVYILILHKRIDSNEYIRK